SDHFEKNGLDKWVHYSFALYGNMYGIYTNIRVLLINIFGFPPLAFFLASSSIKISIIFPMFFF
ncbi:hypothetical protein, partial [Wolbachia endosymbiont of Protocalliphora sialia]